MREKQGSPDVGSIAWASLGGPPLTFKQRVTFYLGAATELGRTFGRELAAIFGWRARADLTLLELPDSPAVGRSVELLATMGAGDTAMTNHSHRCWHLAMTMARLDGVSLDEEVLAVAMLLHDIGLFEAARQVEDANEFTVRGARIATRVLRDVAWPSRRIDLVVQAITVNANPRVSLARWGPEAYYARLAPVCDGLGQAWRIPVGIARELATRFPHDGLGEAVSRHVLAEARRQPGGRFSLLRHFFPATVRWGVRRWRP